MSSSMRCFSLAGLLLKLQELISKVPILKRDQGFTKPGPYIYEMLKSLNITHETAPKLIGTVEEAAVLLEEEKQRTATNAGSKLEIIADMLKLIFREDGSNHADVYRVSFKQTVLYIPRLQKPPFFTHIFHLQSQDSSFVRFMYRSLSKILLIKVNKSYSLINKKMLQSQSNNRSTRLLN